MNRTSKTGFILIVFLAWFSASSKAFAEPEILIKGLFKNAAVLVIDGHQELLKVGKRTKSGVLLVSASSKGAVVEFEGERKQLYLTRGIGTSYSNASKKEVRLASQHNGHFFGTALINGQRRQFLVDTGASTISMSSKEADMLGIQYKNSKVVRVATAQGVTRGYEVKLRRVEIGGIRINNVGAIILEGEYPLDILLGNTFLSQVNVNIDNGVLIMQSKY